jgi:hypothetical protein
MIEFMENEEIGKRPAAVRIPPSANSYLERDIENMEHYLASVLFVFA